jgi:hypothetical protein
MKRIRIVVIALVAVALILVGAHLAINANWPELLKSIHGS